MNHLPLLPWFLPYSVVTTQPGPVGEGHKEVTTVSVKSGKIRLDRCQSQGRHHSQLVIQITSFLTIAAEITHEITGSLVIAIGIPLVAPIGSLVRWESAPVWGAE